jgi:hypothetical protein
MASNALRHIKGWIHGYPHAYRGLSNAYNSFRYLPLLIKRKLVAFGTPEADIEAFRQKPLDFEVAFPNVQDFSSLLGWLQRQGIEVREGFHALYLPPQPRLSDLFPSVVGFYPVNTGFKILKDLQPVDKAHYLRGDRQTHVRNTLIGPIACPWNPWNPRKVVPRGCISCSPTGRAILIFNPLTVMGISSTRLNWAVAFMWIFRTSAYQTAEP